MGRPRRGLKPGMGPGTGERPPETALADRGRRPAVASFAGGLADERMADLVFGQGAAGRTVLDVNCASGYFCLEALARGARRAVGWDVDPERIRRARGVAEMLGAPVEYVERTVETVASHETFDIVLCLDLLHRLRDPLSALDTLVRLTRDRLIVEAASLDAEAARRLGLSRRRRALVRSPVIVVGRGGTSPPFDREARFLLSPAALENLLKFHHQRFAHIRVVETTSPDRFVVIAERRRIGHLLVVAGPMSSGKSRLIKEIRADRHLEIGAALGIEDLGAWPSIGARFLTHLTDPMMKDLILHYDFLRPFRRGTGMYEGDEALQVLEGAEVVSFVTLWTPPSRLERQHLESKIWRPWQMGAGDPAHPRRVAPRGGLGTRMGRLPLVGRLLRRFQQTPSPRHLDVLGLYRQPEQVVEAYRRWFEFCDRHAPKTRTHLIVECGDGLKTYSREEWEEEVRIYGSASEGPEGS